MAPAFTCVIATSPQTAVLAGYLATREPGQIGRVFASPRAGLLVGLGVGHPLGWFTAFTLQIAAYVRMLGLVELAVTLLISLYAFRERPGRFEVSGLGPLILSTALVLNGSR